MRYEKEGGVERRGGGGKNNPVTDHAPISAEHRVSTPPYVMHVPRSIAVIKWPFESDARIPVEYGFNIQPDARARGKI